MKMKKYFPISALYIILCLPFLVSSCSLFKRGKKPIPPIDFVNSDLDSMDVRLRLTLRDVQLSPMQQDGQLSPMQQVDINGYGYLSLTKEGDTFQKALTIPIRKEPLLSLFNEKDTIAFYQDINYHIQQLPSASEKPVSVNFNPSMPSFDSMDSSSSPTTNTEDDWSYKDAHFTYDVPRKVTQGKVFQIEAYLTLPQITSLLREKSMVSFAAVTSHIEITNTVEVTLKPTDESAFIIISQRKSDEQFIDLNTKKCWKWAWNVTPLKSGKHKISIVVDAKRKDVASGAFGPEMIEINVKANNSYKAASFIGTYWQWLTTVMALPLLVWAYNLFIAYRKKQREKGKSKIIRP